MKQDAAVGKIERVRTEPPREKVSPYSRRDSCRPSNGLECSVSIVDETITQNPSMSRNGLVTSNLNRSIPNGHSVNLPLRIDINEFAAFQRWPELAVQAGSCRIVWPQIMRSKVGLKFRGRNHFLPIDPILRRGRAQNRANRKNSLLQGTPESQP